MNFGSSSFVRELHNEGSKHGGLPIPKCSQSHYRCVQVLLPLIARREYAQGLVLAGMSMRSQSSRRFLTWLFLLAFSRASWAQTSANLELQELPTEVVQCTHWLETIVPKSTMSNAPNFCSGIVNVRETVEWAGSSDCPESPVRVADAPRRFCASYGRNDYYETFAVGVTSTSSQGRDFIDGALPGPNDPAVLFTKKPIWIGDLLLPAGMYNLQISRSPEESTLNVSKQNGDAGSYLGSVKMKSAPVEGMPVPWLSIQAWPTVRDGPTPLSEALVNEMHFTWGDTNLFVRIRPDASLRGSNRALTR